MLLLLALVAGSQSVWGQASSIEINTTSFTKPNSGSGYDAYNGTRTIGNVSITSSNVMINNSALQFKKSGGNLYNSTAMPGNITKITLTNSTSFTIYVGSESNPGTTTVTSGSTISGDYTFFKVANNTSGALSTASITIEYASGGGGSTPSFTADNVNIAYNATGGSITYNVNNGVEGGSVSAAVSEGNWLTLGNDTASPISFTCSANSETTTRTATVTLTYTYDTNKIVTKNVTVTQAKAPFAVTDGVFDFVTAGGVGYDYGSSVSTTSSSSYYETDESTWISGNVTMIVSGKYRWWSNDKTLRFYDSSSATFSVPNGYVITKIKSTGGSFVTASVGTLSSGTWTGASQSVKLSISTSSVNFKTITVTYTTATQTKNVTSAGWATYAPEYAVSFRSGTKAYIIELADDTETVLTPVTSVPAGTPVLLEGTKGSEVTHTMDVIASSSTNVSGNYLHVSDGTAKDGIYVLANGKYGVGFYLWTGSSALTAGKIYMQIPSPSRSFISLPNETNGIDAPLTKNKEVKSEVYSLSGQRVAQPTKGLYIVNGKKVIIK